MFKTNSPPSSVLDSVLNRVISETNPEIYYHIDMNRMTCTCPHFQFRIKNKITLYNPEKLYCKHLVKAQKCINYLDQHFLHNLHGNAQFIPDNELKCT